MEFNDSMEIETKMLSIVVARYNEDIEWLDSVKEYVDFYDKPPTHAYLSYIVENYDNLPSVVCFTSDKKRDLDYLIKVMNSAVTSESGLSDNFIKDNNSIKDFSDWFVNTFRTEVPEPLHIYLDSFAVCRNRIKMRSLNFYKSLLTQENSNFIEKAWYYVFQEPVSDLDAIYFCSKTPYATYKTLESFRKHHPWSKVFLISDNGYDYTEMANHFNCEYTHLTENTNTIFGVYRNFSESERRRRLTNFLNIYIDKFSNSCAKFFILLEDDVLIQDKIDTSKYKGAINGAVINRLPDMFFSNYYRNEQTIPPSGKFFCGHGGSLFHRTQLLECLTSRDMVQRAVETYIECGIMGGVIIHDIFFSLLVHLKGFHIINMDNHMEVDTHKFIKRREDATILHQVKDYYTTPMPVDLQHLVKLT